MSTHADSESEVLFEPCTLGSSTGDSAVVAVPAPSPIPYSPGHVSFRTIERVESCSEYMDAMLVSRGPRTSELPHSFLLRFEPPPPGESVLPDWCRQYHYQPFCMQQGVFSPDGTLAVLRSNERVGQVASAGDTGGVFQLFPPGSEDSTGPGEMICSELNLYCSDDEAQLPRSHVLPFTFSYDNRWLARRANRDDPSDLRGAVLLMSLTNLKPKPSFTAVHHPAGAVVAFCFTKDRAHPRLVCAVQPAHPTPDAPLLLAAWDLTTGAWLPHVPTALPPDGPASLPFVLPPDGPASGPTALDASVPVSQSPSQDPALEAACSSGSESPPSEPADDPAAQPVPPWLLLRSHPDPTLVLLGRRGAPGYCLLHWPSGAVQAVRQTGDLTALSASPDGQLLLDQLELLQARTLRPVGTFVLPAERRLFKSSFLRSGRVLVLYHKRDTSGKHRWFGAKVVAREFMLVVPLPPTLRAFLHWALSVHGVPAAAGMRGRVTLPADVVQLVARLLCVRVSGPVRDPAAEERFACAMPLP